MEAPRRRRIVLKAVTTTKRSRKTMNDPTDDNARAQPCCAVILFLIGFPPVPALSIAPPDLPY